MNVGLFFKNDTGNFAIIASVLAVPLVAAAGIALDLSTVSRTRSELQHAMDAAVLAVAREGNDIDARRASEIARQFIASNYLLKYTDFGIERSSSGVSLTAKTKAGLSFGGLFGYSDWTVVASSSADLAFVSYEIALVLDTTGSMAGGKLQSMKDAVHGMIKSMTSQVKDEKQLRFSMVPFATFVNVGPENGPAFTAKGKMVKGSGASWLDLKGKSDIPQVELKKGVSRFEVMHKMGQPWKGCVETRMASRKGAHDTADTPATSKDVRSLFVPAFAIDEPDTPGYENSYVVSDANPLDASAAGAVKKLKKYGIAPAAVGGDDDDDDEEGGATAAAGLVVEGAVLDDLDAGEGPGRGCDTQPLTPLTSDYAALLAKVDSLTASGTTNIMEGVAWGTRVLSPGEPFAHGLPADKGLEKIMIVLTDGANNVGPKANALRSSYSSFGYLVDGRLDGGASSDPTVLMNAKTLAACASAKAQGMAVYTIRLEEPDIKTGSMLRDCATSPAHYFDAPSRSQLDEVFEAIGQRVVRLRISS